MIGQIISLFGNAVIRFALLLHLLNVTGSAALLGLVLIDGVPAYAAYGVLAASGFFTMVISSLYTIQIMSYITSCNTG